MQAQWFVILLFAGTIGLGIYMLYRAWRIGRDLRRPLADWMGNPLPDRCRPALMVLNVIAGAALLGVAIATPAFGLPFAWWTGLTAIVFWSYFLTQQLVTWKARQAADRARKSGTPDE